jgi:predicted CoA-substrate-specific enzyme activase
MTPAYFAGIDLGSSFAKVVIIDGGGASGTTSIGNGSVMARAIHRTGIDFDDIAAKTLDEALASAKLQRKDLSRICVTGVGRRACTFADLVKPEIVCFARGVYAQEQKACTIVDIGGQDNKVVLINDAGKQLNFKMNRKCAAGTGAFLEEISHRLDTPSAEMNQRAQSVSAAINIGSYCTVFSVTEIIHHIREGKNISEIFRGVYESVVKRILEMDPLEGDVVLCGGAVAANPVLGDLFREKLGARVTIAPHAQTLGAFGAALYAADPPDGV